MCTSTTDGKIYHFVICTCGKQNSAGICEHVSNPVMVELVPPQPSQYHPVIEQSMGVGRNE